MIIKTILLFVILILSAYYDFKKRIVPDFLTYPGIILGLTFIFILKKNFWWYYLSAGIGGFILVLLIAIIGKLFSKKEGIGGGDIKLIAIIGLFLGIQGLLLVFILSSISGIAATYLIYKNFSKPIPYAFYLSISAIIIYTILFIKF